MKTYLLAAVLACGVILSGCDDIMTPAIEPTDAAVAQSLVDSLVFVKSYRGLCFGVTTTSRLSTNVSISYNQLIVYVDCEKVGL